MQFQVMASIIMGPYMLYFSMVTFVYPMKDYIGEFGCYNVNYMKTAGVIYMQLQSFFMALFRYICLFHDNLLLKYDLSPQVRRSIHFCIRFELIFIHRTGTTDLISTTNSVHKNVNK